MAVHSVFGNSSSRPQNDRQVRPTLRRRIMLIVLGLAILPSSVVLLVSTLVAAGVIRDFVLDESQSVVFSAAEPLATYLNEETGRLVEIAEDPGLGALLHHKFEEWGSGAGSITADQSTMLAGAMAPANAETRLFVFTTAGVAGLLTQQGYAAVGEFPSPGAELEIIERLEGDQDSRLFALETDPETGEDVPAFWAAARLQGEGEPIWLVRRLDPVGVFSGMAWGGLVGKERMLLLSSKSGIIRHAPEEANEAAFLNETSEIYESPNGSIEIPDSDGIIYSFMRVGVFSGLTRPGGQETSLVVARRLDLNEALSALLYRVWQIVLIGMVFICLIGAGGVWLSKRLVDPILVLRAGFSRLESGDLDYRVRVRTGDELEELGTSMNRMAKTLQQTYQNLADKLLELDEQTKQLTLTQRIARAINSSLDLAVLFQVIVREIRQLMPADIVALGVIIHDGKEVEWSHVWAEEGRNPPEGRVTPLAGSLALRAIDAREAQVFTVRDFPETPEGKNVLQVGMVSVCLVPLITTEGPVGMLALADSAEEAYRSQDVKILNEISPSLATALDHSRLYGEQARFATELEAQVMERTRALRDAQEQLVMAEKLAAAGELAANVAHEINNPLSIIKNYLKILQSKMLRYRGSDEDTAVTREGVTIISEEIDRIARIVNQLRSVRREDHAMVRRMEVNTELDQMAELFRQTFHEKRITLETRYDGNLGTAVICGDYLRQILINLLRNACDAVGTDGHIRLETMADAPEFSYFTIAVEDDGPGVPAENLKKIFDPFFTTKKATGSGLGLSVSYGLARRMGGRIEVVNTAGRGARFLVVLPIRQPEDEEISKKSDTSTRGSGEKIIIG